MRRRGKDAVSCYCYGTAGFLLRTGGGFHMQVEQILWGTIAAGLVVMFGGGYAALLAWDDSATAAI